MVAQFFFGDLLSTGSGKLRTGIESNDQEENQQSAHEEAFRIGDEITHKGPILHICIHLSTAFISRPRRYIESMILTPEILAGLRRDTLVVFFTGAGISAESGLSTFRDVDGYWARYDPTQLASPDGFRRDPELVLSWYAHRRESALNAQPNAGHKSISDFQKLFQHAVVITQNVDGLHARAGNREIIELHGNLHRFKCFRCGQPLSAPCGEAAVSCQCGGPGRPDVVWFGENLDPGQLQAALDATHHCGLFFSIGTSSQVYPAAQLPLEAKRAGARVIEINPHLTPMSAMADLTIQAAAGETLPTLYREIHEALAV